MISDSAIMMLNESLNYTSVVPVWITYANSLTIWTILMLIFGAISAILNILLILAIIFNRQVSRMGGSEILLVNFLFIELCISGGIVPALALSTAFARFRPTTESCQIFYLAVGWFAQVDLWAAFSLSFNRLTAIVLPHRHATFSSRKAVLFILIFTWLLPLSVSLPQLAGVTGGYGLVPPWMSCGPLPPKTNNGRALLLLVLALGSYLPIAGIVTSYLAIFAILQVWKCMGSRHTGKADDQQSLEKTKKRLRMAKMLFGSSLWFLSCYLPFTLTLIYFPSLFVTVRDMHLWMRLLYYTGIMGSPVVFLLLSRDYRNRVAQLLDKIWKHSGRKMMRRINIAPVASSVTGAPQRSAFGTSVD